MNGLRSVALKNKIKLKMLALLNCIKDYHTHFLLHSSIPSLQTLIAGYPRLNCPPQIRSIGGSSDEFRNF